MLEKTITIAAALILREDGNVLLVRKNGSPVFMQPGGKIEPGETAAEALRRELNEELGLTIAVDEPIPLGRFAAAAANEPGYRVEAELFLLAATDDAQPGAEIAEMRWVDPDVLGALEIATLSRDHILPLSRPPQRLLALLGRHRRGA
ncbi:mutator mutT protein [Kaistia soli DSM 19436]|uniref:Mutator mutT protein n=1 Tax=Kaistia soli DSM 19436 TaxID=1122133 RepID=A0A1M5DGD2_9HYPH|nr:mutator mutT protein [Kaistia soli DSM 19436]